jgi:predicted esterase
MIRTRIQNLYIGALLVSLAAPVWADPAETANGLREGLTAEQAAAAWTAERTGPEQALEALRALPLIEAPAESHAVTLTDERGRTSQAEIVLPADGPGPDGRYRVLIFLHGLGGDSSQVTDNAAGLVPPHTILIAPTAQRADMSEGSEDLRVVTEMGLPVGRMFRSWYSYMPDAFPLLALDYVRARYPVDHDRVILGGYSMGGFSTQNIGLRYHDRFAGLLPMAGGISRSEYALGRDNLCRNLLGNAAMVRAMFVHGNRDEVVPVGFDRWSHQDLERQGVEHDYVEVEGGSHILREFVQPNSTFKHELRDWMGQRVRDPHPARVVHHLIGDYHSAAYWVRVDAHRGDHARVEAVVTRRGRQIEVQAENVDRLTLFLDPQLVEVDGRVKVLVNGEQVFHGRVEPSLEAVAQSFARCHDVELTYQHMLTLDLSGAQAEARPQPQREEPAPAGGERPSGDSQRWFE